MSVDDHIPESLLARFVAGRVDDAEAVRVAVHVDECALCCGRAARSEFLSQVLEAAPTPMAPLDLVAAVLREADRPEPAPVAEVAIGVGLLLLAVVLMGAGEDPVRLAVDATRAIHALERGAHAMGAYTFVGWAGMAALIGGGVLLVRGRGVAAADVQVPS